MAKPIQFTSVNEVPCSLWGACLAIREENRGESAVPDRPQQNKNIRKGYTEPLKRKRGESRQHIPEMASEIVAIFFAPNLCESNPPAMHESAPEAMIRKENKETLRGAAGWL